jgi:hypothetical protein
MAIDAAYFEYPHRSYGMDQPFYPYSSVFDRPPITWPNGARVALVVAPQLEFFPFDSTGKPLRAPGALLRPYPNYWEYTQRDYGLRVGIQRVFRVLERLNLPASVGVPAAVAEHFPSLAAEVADHGWEIVAAVMDRVHVAPASTSKVWNEFDRAGDTQPLIASAPGTARNAASVSATMVRSAPASRPP